MFPLKLMEITHVSPKFDRLFGEMKPLCMHLISSINEYLNSINIAATMYVLDVYNLGEGEYIENKPYIEVHVLIKDVNEMLNLWEETIRFLETQFDKEILDMIDIFFKRA